MKPADDMADQNDMDIDMDIDLSIDPDVSTYEAEAMYIVRNQNTNSEARADG